jgi:replication factor C subunit 2/4
MSTLALPFPQPLSDKYKPETISEFVGLEKPRKIMQRFIENPYPSVWLFEGPSGTGKTSMAQAICKAVAGELHLITSQSCDLATVKKTVDICHRFPYDMMNGKACTFHYVLCEEADQMSNAAQLAFLSILDGSAMPPNTIFVFTCNSVDRFEARFLSRCRRVQFSSYGMADGIKGLLERIWDKEVDSPTERPNFARIAKESNNNVRDALMTLEVQIMGA